MCQNSHIDLAVRIYVCARNAGWNKEGLLDELVDAVAYLRCEEVIAKLEQVARNQLIREKLSELERTEADVPE